MSLIEINWNPSRQTLRDFGVIGLIACPILAGVFFWQHLPTWFCWTIVGLGLLLFVISRLSMALTRWVFIGLTLIGAPIGMVVGVIVLGIIFFGLLTPLGLAFRLAGRDPLRLRRDPNRTTNWQSHTQTQDLKRYFRPF